MAVIKRRNNLIPPQPMIKEVVEDELESIKQGIVTILRSDPQSPDKSSSSIRRTLSADMSSKKWLAQNGFLTQTTAKNNFQHSSPYEGGEKTVKSNPGQDDVWTSIQSQKKIKESNPFWGSIPTNQKDCNDHKSRPTPLPPPYVPAKRSSSILSEKSLEICTESLGSESGSDSFLSSSYSSGSDYSSFQDADDHQEREKILTDREEEFKDYNSYENMRVVKYKSTPVRPFPPPIRSISTDGDSLHVQSRRENGRLVLEAVSVPPRNYFHAKRGDGRLVLTLIRHHKASSDQFASEENKKIDEETKAKGGIQEEEGDNKYEVAEQEVRSLLSPNRMIRAHKSISPGMNSLTSPGKKNPTWISKEEVRDHHQIQITQSLPSPRVSMMITQTTPPCTTASPFNAYEHFWRNKTTTMVAKRSGFTNPVIDNSKSMSLKNYKANDDHNIYVAKQYMNRDLAETTKMMRGGKVESLLVPYLKKGCKEPKRSLLIWEPCCIATS